MLTPTDLSRIARANPGQYGPTHLAFYQTLFSAILGRFVTPEETQQAVDFVNRHSAARVSR